MLLLSLWRPSWYFTFERHFRVTTLMLLQVRTLYRIVESSSPRDMSSYVHSHEWPFWAFDAIPMLGMVV